MTLKKLGTSLRSSISLILRLVSIPFGLSSTLIGGCTCIMMQCGLAVFGVIVVGFSGFICCIQGTLLFWRHVRLLFLATGGALAVTFAHVGVWLRFCCSPGPSSVIGLSLGWWLLSEACSFLIWLVFS